MSWWIAIVIRAVAIDDIATVVDFFMIADPRCIFLGYYFHYRVAIATCNELRIEMRITVALAVCVMRFHLLKSNWADTRSKMYKQVAL